MGLVNTIKIENTPQNMSSGNRSHGIGEVTSSLQLPVDSADKKVSHIVWLALTRISRIRFSGSGPIRADCVTSPTSNI